ncbi:MAG: 4Fe-4S dicluster domain-containing protein [Syntrophorhabdales bacterium]
MTKKITEDLLNRKRLSRRSFLKLSGTAALGMAAGSIFPGGVWLDRAVAAIPVSLGYLLVDTKKCQGCLSCMLACSLVHEGVEDLSLSRIQVVQDSLQKWPEDLSVEQCRQCVDPACVRSCPTGALRSDPRFGNVRAVDAGKCVGCKKCLSACPFPPGRTVWNPAARRAAKCDLCAGAPHHWDKAGGGPGGKQACVEVCPVKAIKFTAEIPVQEGDTGYKVNLRGPEWRRLGYPTK